MSSRNSSDSARSGTGTGRRSKLREALAHAQRATEIDGATSDEDRDPHAAYWAYNQSVVLLDEVIRMTEAKVAASGRGMRENLKRGEAEDIKRLKKIVSVR
jgi:hypothetical protein